MLDVRARRQGRRRDDAARRRVQAAHEPVRVPGHGPRRAEAAARGGRRDRPARRDRGARRARRREGRRVRGRAPGRRAQHAELHDARGARPDAEAGAAQARACPPRSRSCSRRRSTCSRAATATSSCASAASARSRRTRATRSTSRPSRRSRRSRTCRSSSTRRTRPGAATSSRRCAARALAAGADGMMVEVHPDPEHARCDGPQSLTPEEFGALMGSLEPLVAIEGKSWGDGVGEEPRRGAQDARVPDGRHRRRRA